MTAPRSRKPSTGIINRGRYHEYRLDGEKVPGVTTIIGDGLPKPALTNWAAKATAEWVADNLHTTVADLDRQAFVDLAKGAPWRDRDQAGNRGTEVHGIAQRLSEGDQMLWEEVPDEIRGHVEQYLQFRDDWQPQDVGVERVVLNRKQRYMGKTDWWGTLGRAPELGLVLSDLKTSRSGVFGEVALQLAAYRYAEAYINDDGNEVEMPEFDTVTVLWLASDSYELREVDAGPDAFRSFLYVAQVAEFQKVTSQAALGAPLPRPS